MSFPIVIAAGAVSVYSGLLLLFHSARRVLLAKETGVQDLPLLAEARAPHKKIKGTAVICGGSVAGLLAARVCHDHYERVVIIEPEAWLATEHGQRAEIGAQEQRRTRIMQYHQLQVIAAFNFLVYKQLFPSFEKECEASDIPLGPADWNFHMYGRLARAPLSEYGGTLPKTLFSSRKAFEAILRRLLFQNGSYPNIEWVVGTATAVSSDSNDSTRLNKVTIRDGDGNNRDFHVHLAIDCTGPTAAGVKMIKRAGYGTAESYPKGSLPLDDTYVHYDQKVQYVTFEFVVPPELARRLPVEATQGQPGLFSYFTDYTDRRSVYASRLEGHKLHICCEMWGEGELPETLDGIKVHCQTLIGDAPLPDWWYRLLDMLSEAEDTMTHSHVRLPPTGYTRYQLAQNLPSNYIALGDSVMRLNPVFAQGFTKCSLGILVLNNMLHALAKSQSETMPLPQDFSSRFFKTQAAKIEPMWNGNKTHDYGYEQTVPLKGEELSHGSFLRWYTHKLNELVSEDAQVGSVMWHVGMGLAPTIDTLHPLIILKVIWRVFSPF